MNIVSLLEELVNGLISAAFLGNVLTSINQKIYEDGWRQGKYTVQRTDKRTLISSVGDISFDSTYYREKENKEYHYLVEEVLGLGSHERFTEEAEVILLTEAMKTSYAEAARSLPSKQEITKTTVMNKVHRTFAEKDSTL